MHILLIEPNHVLGRTYSRALERAGHVVTWRKSAQAAVSAADNRLPDLVVLELQLAGHSGVEFLYEFRSYADWQRIPVVVQSFVPEEALVLQRHQLKPLGVAAYLYKPATNLQRLVRAISEAVPAVA